MAGASCSHGLHITSTVPSVAGSGTTDPDADPDQHYAVLQDQLLGHAEKLTADIDRSSASTTDTANVTATS